MQVVEVVDNLEFVQPTATLLSPARISWQPFTMDWKPEPHNRFTRAGVTRGQRSGDQEIRRSGDQEEPTYEGRCGYGKATLKRHMPRQVGRVRGSGRQDVSWSWRWSEKYWTNRQDSVEVVRDILD